MEDMRAILSFVATFICAAKTLWGEREQTIHCGIEMLCSQGFAGEVSYHSSQATWRVAKQQCHSTVHKSA